jgi:hypothetical protein
MDSQVNDFLLAFTFTKFDQSKLDEAHHGTETQARDITA